MNYRKFCNYLTAIVNAENARQNNHDNEASATFVTFLLDTNNYQLNPV